jgi:hypothetical protein
MKGIQNCSNKGPGRLQMEIITQIGWFHLRIFFSRTTGPEKSRQIEVCSNNGPRKLDGP